MNPRILLIAGLLVLVAAWAGPLPSLVPSSFAVHMLLHMCVVAIGVPLLAAGLAPRLPLRVARWASMLAILGSVADLVVIWAWHAPALHDASRSTPLVLVLEQASFFAVALLVWVAALAGPPLVGALALFFTSMHMTLLGALSGLAPRPIYGGHHHGGWLGLAPLADQQLGGAVMLGLGGAVYLFGGLALMARVLKPKVPS